MEALNDVRGRPQPDRGAARVVFSDFDEFADSIRGISGRFVPTARSDRDWWVDVAALGRVEIQQLQIGGASTYAGDGTPNTLTLGIPLMDSRRIRIDGLALEENSLIFLKRDQPFTFAAREATWWGGITIHLDAQMHAEMFDAERVMASLRPGTRAQSHMSSVNRLRQLITRIGAQRDTEGLLDPAAARSAEEDVFEAVLQTIDSSSATRECHVGRPMLMRSRILATMIALVEAKQGEPLFINDLCKATGVSERTLRNVCHEYFGVGPMRLLKVRQLVEIRRALLAADPTRDAVAKIAARFGVWDFSLFARNYKALYGESPSHSLLHSPRSLKRTTGAWDTTWISYAARRFAARGDLF